MCEQQQLAIIIVIILIVYLLYNREGFSQGKPSDYIVPYDQAVSNIGMQNNLLSGN